MEYPKRSQYKYAKSNLRWAASRGAPTEWHEPRSGDGGSGLIIEPCYNADQRNSRKPFCSKDSRNLHGLDPNNQQLAGLNCEQNCEQKEVGSKSV